MEKHLNKKLEETTARMMQGVDVEKPSIDFTASLMQGIHELETRKVTLYKPLISKSVWVGIALAFIGVIYFIAATNDPASSGLFNNLDFSVLTNNKITNGFSSISLPKTLVYAIGLFGFMLCVQIPFLKQHFDKRMSL